MKIKVQLIRSGSLLDLSVGGTHAFKKDNRLIGRMGADILNDDPSRSKQNGTLANRRKINNVALRVGSTVVIGSSWNIHWTFAVVAKKPSVKLLIQILYPYNVEKFSFRVIVVTLFVLLLAPPCASIMDAEMIQGRIECFKESST